MPKETLDTLWEYCTMKKRAVPCPMAWNKLYGMLMVMHQKSFEKWEKPSPPLILASWHYSTPIQKQRRFKEHLHWADSKGLLNEVGAFLRSLPEEKWCHFGKL